MASRPPVSAVIGLPPTDTVRAFEARDELRTTVRWSEMWHEDHARAFTVAKVAKLDLLRTIRDSLDRVMREGGTFEQWQAQLVPELQRAGWWGRVVDRELTGTSRPVLVGPRRLRTIYQTNLRVSRAAGQWARIQALKGAAPYLRYSAVLDNRTRRDHRDWHGTILPVDHPWWETHFPPCGWNCRCTTIQLSEADLRRNGWSVTKTPPRDGPPRSFWRAGADKPVTVPRGIDPGWAYHPGQASMRAISDRAAVVLEETAGHDLASARAILRDLVDSPSFLQAMDEPGSQFPVMILGEEARAAIGARARTAVLSSETFAKQRRRHPELEIAQYRQLPDIGADPTLIFQQDDRRLIMMRTADGRWLKAAVKVTADRGELFVVSLQWARASEIQRLRRRHRLIFGQIAGALAALLLADVAAESEGTEAEQA